MNQYTSESLPAPKIEEVVDAINELKRSIDAINHGIRQGLQVSIDDAGYLKIVNAE